MIMIMRLKKVKMEYLPIVNKHPIIDLGATRLTLQNLAHFSKFQATNDINIGVAVAQGKSF